MFANGGYMGRRIKEGSEKLTDFKYKKMKNLTKEELQKQLNIIAENEEKELINTHYPEFKKLEGKCFKVKNNYSCPEEDTDYWWLYKKVTEIKPEFVYDTRGNGVACHYNGFSFQMDKNGDISVIKEDYGYVHCLGDEISNEEFEEAFKNLKESIETFDK